MVTSNFGTFGLENLRTGAVGSTNLIRIVTYTCGRNLRLAKTKKEIYGKKPSMRALNGKRFAAALRNTVQVFSRTGEIVLRNIERGAQIGRIKSDSQFLAVACISGGLHLRENGGNCSVISSLNMRDYIPSRKMPNTIQALSFTGLGAYFFSIPKFDLVQYMGPKETLLTYHTQMF